MASEPQSTARTYRCADGFWRPSRPEGLARVLAKAGYGARPRTEELVRSGRVSVDDQVELDPGRAVERANRITLDGAVLREAKRSYLAMNKPSGIDCQPRRHVGRWIGDYYPEAAVGVEPVGRLDRRARGLLLLSNDLWWSARITENPDLVRRYEIQISGRVSSTELDVIRAGMNLPGKGYFRPLQIGIVSAEEDHTRLDLAIQGGRLRQARAVFTTLRHEVVSIASTAVGPVKLDQLGVGAIRALTSSEIRRLATPL